MAFPKFAGITGRIKRFTEKYRQHLIAWGITISVVLAVSGVLLYRQWLYGTPHFAYSLGRTADQALPTAQEPAAGVDLATTTADDFPEFLGSGRHAAVDRIDLDPDWKGNPPRQLWRKPIGGGFSAFSVVNGFAVTMEQRGEEEQVTCYASASGQHHWTASWNERFTTNGVGPRSTPTISGGRIYALGAWGHLVCLDGNTGEVIWKRELLWEQDMHWSDENRSVRFGRSNSPLVTGNLVIVPGGGISGNRASLLAFDAATGDLRWRGGDRQISYSSPVMAELLGEKQILSVNEDTVSGHSPETGVELWSYPWPGNSRTDANVSQPVRLSSSRILLSAGYRRGAAVIELERRAAGEAIKVRCVWKHSSVLNTKFTNVVIWKDHAYGLSEGVLECVNLGTGERCWKEGRYGNGQILRVRGLLLVLGEEGELVLVRLDPEIPNAVLGRLQALSDTTWNNMALYGRQLLVRNTTESACYELATVHE
ncbi:MAG TPA: hypothetical protein DET40_00430 [Lentisphaeria bacterium]|nr:MAG: hypothetical protein A2X45_05055 [Lentisphaerae bacterium GWF2_50_93]HCE41999.1 hypothetical protein [Lentisphaeria bacterium]